MYGWSIYVGADPMTTVPLRRAASGEEVHGVMAGTAIASSDGWRPVEALAVGDRVWTFDNGLRPILEIRRTVFGRTQLDREKAPAPLVIPAAALGNEADITLLPHVGLLLECENASDAMGDPFAVIPITALDGICGIHRAPAQRRMEVFSLIFAEEEVIYIDSGLLIHCPLDADGSSDEAFYDVKTPQAAKAILTDLDLAELALREANEEFFGTPDIERVA